MFQFSLNLKDYLERGHEMRLQWKSSPRSPRVMLTASRVHTELLTHLKDMQDFAFSKRFLPIICS